MASSSQAPALTFLKDHKFFNKYHFVLEHNKEKFCAAYFFFTSWGFPAVSLCNLTASPHPVWLLAGVLAAAWASVVIFFADCFFFFFFYSRCSSSMWFHLQSWWLQSQREGRRGERVRKRQRGGLNSEKHTVHPHNYSLLTSCGSSIF